MHVVTRFFDRYGSPSNVSAEYNDFASWFLKTFAVGILNSVLTVLAGYGAKADGSKKYVSPRVLQQCLNYVNTAVAHAVTWKVMKVRDCMAVSCAEMSSRRRRWRPPRDESVSRHAIS